MTKVKYAISSVAMLAAFIGSSAYAADPVSRGGLKDDIAPAAARAINWTGFYVGAHAGVSNSTDDMKYDDWCSKSFKLFDAEVDGFSSHGLMGGVTIGADLARDRLLVGVFGDYDWSNAEAKAHVGMFNDTRAANGSIEDGNSWTIAARAGALLGEEKRTLVYGLIGWSQEDATFKLSTVPVGGGGSKDVTFSGVTAGGGIQYALNNMVSIGVEYRHFFGGTETLFDDRNATTGAGDVLTDKRDSDKIMGRINLKVGPGLFGY